MSASDEYTFVNASEVVDRRRTNGARLSGVCSFP
jgi:hypothetical protein